MFDYITDLYITAGISLLAVIIWLVCVQYSEFTLHRKQHQNDEPSKAKDLADRFCFIPYLVIPIMGGILATFLGLTFTNWVIGHGYVTDTDTIYAVAIMASILIYGILDITFFSKVGDVTYFRFFEEKFLKAVDETPETVTEISSEQELVILLQKLLKK